MTSQLLPPNSTALERALADLAGEALSIPVLVGTLWNPWTCPEPLLPWLAWAFSVDVWEDDWSADTKRQVIAASFEVHATKGTRGALMRALAPFGLDVDLVEWWEREHPGEPFTFDVTAWVTSTPASAAVQSGLLRTIESTKPLRAHMSGFAIGVHFGQELGVAGAGSHAEMVDAGGDLSGRAGIVADIGFATAITSSQEAGFVGEISGRSQLLAEAGLGAAIDGHETTRHEGNLAGRSTLAGEIGTAQALMISPAPTPMDGTVAARSALAMTQQLAGAIEATSSVEFFTPEEEGNVFSSIRFAGAGMTETVITVQGRSLVAIQGDEIIHLGGPPQNPDIQILGIADGAEGGYTVTFGAPPGDVRPGDWIVCETRIYFVAEPPIENVITIVNPLEAPIDGGLVMRLRGRI